MPTVLGIIGSARVLGNSDLLTRQALLGAQAEAASVKLLRLTGLNIQPCTGCMRCVMGRRPCKLDDDMAWLIETIQAAEALVLVAPTYFLGPAAILKLVLDRLLMVTGRVDDPLPQPRPAVTVAAAGLEGWRGVTLPFLNAFAAAFGFHPIESMSAIAPGPGEALLNEALMASVLDAGRRLGRLELEPGPSPPLACPTCHGDSFVLSGRLATCPICGQEAKLSCSTEGARLEFKTEQTTPGRWTPEGMRIHMKDWVIATGPRFFAQRHEIKARRKPLLDTDIPWLCPPSVTAR